MWRRLLCIKARSTGGVVKEGSNGRKDGGARPEAGGGLYIALLSTEGGGGGQGHILIKHSNKISYRSPASLHPSIALSFSLHTFSARPDAHPLFLDRTCDELDA